jgi:hypothetical protein
LVVMITVAAGSHFFRSVRLVRVLVFVVVIRAFALPTAAAGLFRSRLVGAVVPMFVRGSTAWVMAVVLMTLAFVMLVTVIG